MAKIISTRPLSIISMGLKYYLEQNVIFSAVQSIPLDDIGVSSSKETFLIVVLDDYDFNFDRLFYTLGNYPEIGTTIPLVVFYSNEIDASKIKLFLRFPLIGVINALNVTTHIVCYLNMLKSGLMVMCAYTQRLFVGMINEVNVPLNLDGFNKTEQSIIHLARKNLPIIKIAEELKLSKNTVAAYRSKILKKSGAPSFSQLLTILNHAN